MSVFLNFLKLSNSFQTCSKNLIQKRGFRKSYGKILKTMKIRREIAGPERIRRRNEWLDWNYQAELFAFPRRLKENISEETLRCAFIHDSYIKMEERKRKELEIPTQDVRMDMKSNLSLVNLGHDIIINYINKYLSYSYHKLPKEGIAALLNYIMSDELLSHVSFNIGTQELIFCEEYPPNKSTLAESLKAIIGSIATDNNIARAENFVLDFICPQLIGKDVFEIWNLENPTDILNYFLESHGFEKHESRLVFESGRNTIESIYHVGLYSNKQFLGRGPGETLQMAEEMAAYDALRKVFHVKDSDKPLYHGDKARAEHVRPLKIVELAKWKSDSFKTDLCL